jgi:DNA-binding MarR family transcriptional regulator
MKVLDELIDQVRAVFFEMRGISEQMLADLDCTGAERSLLVELDKEGSRTVPQLARVRSITRQAMQKAVDRLVKRRWVQVVANPLHQRSSLVALTTAGRSMLAEIRAREVALLTRTKLPVSQTELRAAAQTLSRLASYFAALELRP